MSESSHFRPHTERLRVTDATKRRDRNVRIIIDALRCGPSLKDDLRDMLDISQSSITKYLQLLREAGVIELASYVDATRNSLGTPVYRIAADAALVAAYLRSIDDAMTPKPEPGTTHHIHRLQDDGHWPNRVPKVAIPPPDPVLAHFFGRAQQPA